MKTNNIITRAVALTLTFAAALLVTPAPASPALAQSVNGKPQQVRLDFKRGNKKTGLKLFVDRGALTKVTASDSAGTREMKRTDKLTLPCADGERECKTVELEDGTRVNACYCKGSDAILIALLVPAVQKVRDAAAGSSAGPHVKVFDGTTGAAAEGDGRKVVCWADEKLKLSICPE